MRKGLTVLISLAASTFLAGASGSLAQEKRSWKPEDFARIRDVSDPQISPDGAWIAYTVKTVDLAKDKSAVNLWLANWIGSESLPITFGDETQTHPRFSPDGKNLAFLSSRTDSRESDQLWVWNRRGGDAEKITDTKGGVDDFAWSPDGKKLEPLTSGAHDDVLPSWSPDSREIAFVTRRGDDPDRTDNWDIYVVEARAGGKERQLTTSLEADNNPDWETAPAWSPDGKWIAYLHGGDPKLIEYVTNTLAVVPASGGASR